MQIISPWAFCNHTRLRFRVPGFGSDFGLGAPIFGHAEIYHGLSRLLCIYHLNSNQLLPSTGSCCEFSS